MMTEKEIVIELSKLSENCGYEKKKMEEIVKLPCSGTQDSIKERETKINFQTVLINKLEAQMAALINLFN